MDTRFGAGDREPTARVASAWRTAALAAPAESRHNHPVASQLTDQDAPSRGARVKQFFVELKRRKVYRVAVGYVVVAWVLVQVATQVFPFFEVPTWTVRLIILALCLGFPIAVVLAWAYDITPSGIKRTEDVAPFAASAGEKHRRSSF